MNMKKQLITLIAAVSLAAPAISMLSNNDESTIVEAKRHRRRSHHRRRVRRHRRRRARRNRRRYNTRKRRASRKSRRRKANTKRQKPKRIISRISMYSNQAGASLSTPDGYIFMSAPQKQAWGLNIIPNDSGQKMSVKNIWNKYKVGLYAEGQPLTIRSWDEKSNGRYDLLFDHGTFANVKSITMKATDPATGITKSQDVPVLDFGFDVI